MADLEKSLDQNVITELPYATYVLGNMYKDIGNLDQALRLFEQSDTLAVKNFSMYVHTNNLVGLAEIFFLKWEREHKSEYREKILECGVKHKQVWEKGYYMFHHMGRMTRILGDLAYAEGHLDEALEHYAQAYALLGGRSAGYGPRTFRDELSELEKRIVSLPPRRAIVWCDKLEEAWSDPKQDIKRREDLLSMCRIRRTEARLKLV
jgi:tetratricopeptide (TPR) repeat protein